MLDCLYLYINESGGGKGWKCLLHVVEKSFAVRANEDEAIEGGGGKCSIAVSLVVTHGPEIFGS